jgi:hypothetical protein
MLAADLFDNNPKSNLVQYRSCTIERNGPGGKI